MRAILAPLFVGTLLLATASAPAQDTRSGVQGVLRSDGTFRPFVLRAITKGATGTQVTGMFTATITFKVVTSFASITASPTYQCVLSATAEGESSSGLIDDFVESTTIPAWPAGSNYTCSPEIPYQWMLYGSADRVSITYTISALNGAAVMRSSQGTLATIPMPTSATTILPAVNTRI